MKFSGFAATIAAAFLATALALPGVASAQREKAGTPTGDSTSSFGASRDGSRPPTDAKAANVKPPSKEQIEKGAKDAPALITATGIQCTPDQMIWKGKGTDPKTKVESNAYEVSCKEGLGYLLVTTSAADSKPVAFDCLSAAGASSKQGCTLPGNADPKKGVVMRAVAAGRQCTMKDVEYTGTSVSSGESFYEVGCTPGPGFRMGIKGPTVTFTECLALIGSGQDCKMTTSAEAQAVLLPAVKASGKTCDVKEIRFVGSATDGGDSYYEVGCNAGPGYMLDLGKNYAFKQAIDCGRAQGIGGGCKLTDVSVTESADAATYTKLAAKAAYPCTVSKYRLIGVDKQNREVVELACSNRPDGAVAVFADPGKSDIYDCVMAGKLGQECKLSKSDLPFKKYSDALVAKGKGTCKVSDARFIGSSPTADYVETACSDGLPGWVIAMAPGSQTVSELLTCKQATASGAPCKLPTNLKGNGG